jgi:beta-lactamase regulating signal transducer with metallopeptidase domain
MEPLVRWLLTYLVHSTLLLGAAALARLALRDRRLALQEAVLRAALVGGFVTASLQVGLDVRPLGGALSLPGPGPAVAAVRVPAAVPSRAAAPPRWQGRPVVTSDVPAWAWTAVDTATARWRTGLVLAWAALGSLALARLAVAALRLRRLLRDRRPIEGGGLAPEAATMARALRLRGRVRLSTAPWLSAPLATGVLRPEVCLPTRAVAELAADEQAALCAHELAHVARRDPAWILLARLAEAAGPLQPLNAWARRRLQDLAECLSDDLAVAASGRPVGLARSLVDVASWTLGERSLLPVAAAGALSARSRLGHRVERLMDPARALERPRRILLPAAAAAVLATALVTPVVSGSAAPQEPAPAPEARPAPPPPEARPVPEAQPAPPAAPAPAARAARAPRPAPAARRAPPAPSADAASATDPEERLAELSRRIAERARLHEADVKKLEAEVQAVVSRFQPDQAEMDRLSKEIQKAAQELAESVSADVAAGSRKTERTAEAARRMAELREQIQATARATRVPSEEIRALAEKARALAEAARPTAEETREIGRLSADAARRAAEQVRDAMRVAEEALRQAGEELRRAGEKPRD